MQRVSGVVDADPPSYEGLCGWVWDHSGRVLCPLVDLVDQVDGEVVVERQPAQIVSESIAFSETTRRRIQGLVDVSAGEGKIPELVRGALRGTPLEAPSEELRLRMRCQKDE